ncbi:MAG: class I SAM-dependent methyltransferase [Thermodesulfobacteriota bacterium]
MLLRSEKIRTIYDGYSRVYDLLFKGFFYPRIRHAIDTMEIKPGDKILDVGVGTGLSLPLYPAYCNVIGIDFSSQMLEQAREKTKRFSLSHIHLQEMDAMNIEFATDHFDKVFLSHVVSVVPNPLKALLEAKRVCKPGGKIVIVNHFQSDNKMVAMVERFITPICKRLGWRTDLSLDDVLAGSGLRVERDYKIKKIDFWRIIFATNEK